jgi:uncharacterized OB-fold protein
MTRPQILPRGEEKLYFSALAEGDLTYGFCLTCSTSHFYPRTVCPNCHSDDIEARVGSGRGTIYSFTTQYRAGNPALEDQVPYTIVMVDHAEGCRMLADLVGSEPDDVSIGLPVVAEIETPDNEYPVVHFRVEVSHG